MGPTSLAAALACLLAWNQEGADGPRLGVLPVQAEGQTPAELEAGLNEHLRRGLEAFGPIDVPGTACADAACHRDAAAQAGVGLMVGLSLTSEARDYTLRLQLVDGGTGEVVRVDESRCEICTYDEVLERLDEDLANLRTPIEEALSRVAVPMARVHIVSKPRDAIVRIDGRVVGSTPFDAEVPIGTHEIELSKEGYAPSKRALEVTGDDERAVDITLRRSLGGAGIQRILGWSAVGLAVPLVVTGIALLAIDERPYEPSCDGLEGTCAKRYNTLGGGLVALIGGVAAAGAGATLLVLDKRERGRVEAWIGPGGGGVRGKF